MDIHGHPWISMDIHGYPWISMDIHVHFSGPWPSYDYQATWSIILNIGTPLYARIRLVYWAAFRPPGDSALAFPIPPHPTRPRRRNSILLRDRCLGEMGNLGWGSIAGKTGFFSGKTWLLGSIAGKTRLFPGNTEKTRFFLRFLPEKLGFFPAILEVLPEKLGFLETARSLDCL